MRLFSKKGRAQPSSSFPELGIYSMPQLAKHRKKGPDVVLNFPELSVPDSLNSPRSPPSDEPYGFAQIFRKIAGAVSHGERELT